ncbi:hypothetical protein, partial [Achromobacter ruhlandii]|uniref:hypothetical protein n=1 Tax=Achromobacter ruhlandii TaxID=72557 RepID=UPI001B8CD4D2
ARQERRGRACDDARAGGIRAGIAATHPAPAGAEAGKGAGREAVNASALRLRTLGLPRLLAGIAVLVHLLAAVAGLLLSRLVAILRAFLGLLLLRLLLLIGLIRVCHGKSPDKRNHSARNALATAVPGPALARPAARGRRAGRPVTGKFRT